MIAQEWFYKYGQQLMQALAQGQLPEIDPNKETFSDDCGHTLYNVHRREDCTGTCVIHNPTDHHMRDWTLLWRSDRKLFERLCPHGIGHPDVDHITSLKDRYGKHSEERWGDGVHGCDGCCQ